MEKVELYRTNDGRIFENDLAAEAHLDNCMSVLIEKMAHSLCAIEYKYPKIVDYLRDHRTIDIMREIIKFDDEIKEWISQNAE